MKTILIKMDVHHRKQMGNVFFLKKIYKGRTVTVLLTAYIYHSPKNWKHSREGASHKAREITQPHEYITEHMLMHCRRACS